METGRRLNNDVRSSHVSYQRSAESAAAAAHNDVTCCTSATDAGQSHENIDETFLYNTCT